jgi:lipoprotein-anchoring transpeptidase ErfK/SrfK
MTDYPTMPNPALQPKKSSAQHKQTIVQRAPVISHPIQQVAQRTAQQAPRQFSQRPTGSKSKFPLWLFLIPIGLFVMLMLFLCSGFFGLQMIYANSILPHVYVGELSLGGLSQTEAEQVLSSQWQNISLSDNEHTWQAKAAALGMTLDSGRTAQNAFAQGHGTGGLKAFFQDVQVAPVVTIDTSVMIAELNRIAANIETAPVNAGVALVNGEVQPTEPQYGRLIDVHSTVNNLVNNPSAVLEDGKLDLVMMNVAPAVLDSSPIVAEARALLSNPLDIRVFDPVTGDSIYWSLLPQEWGSWLTAVPNSNSPIGLSFAANDAQVRDYLSRVSGQTFDSTRYIDLDESVQEVSRAFVTGKPQSIALIVHHRNRTYTVQSGETITSIAWDFGIPYLYIMQANGGIQSVSIGQQITIPAADIFIDYPVNPNKRIVVDISEQRTRVYENGAMIYDWITSTGIADSPTWTGIYQIQSHELNAYAGNWNLYMPYFMGVYQPIPGADFTNGFHGFPTRGGGQILWQANLGTKVTFGCIMLSDAHIQTLYSWAEEGVIVEIRA